MAADSARRGVESHGGEGERWVSVINVQSDKLRKFPKMLLKYP